jgi:hypothetical protein
MNESRKRERIPITIASFLGIVRVEVFRGMADVERSVAQISRPSRRSASTKQNKTKQNEWKQYI